MPSDDPTEELNEILDLCRQKRLPGVAEAWATDALVTTEEMLETIEEMEGNGYDRTADQEVALENIYTAACNWLKRKPDTL